MLYLVGFLAAWLYFSVGYQEILPRGALVVGVATGQANLPVKTGDLITRADGQPIADGIDLASFLSQCKADSIRIQFVRSGTTVNGELNRQVPEKNGNRKGFGILFESQTGIQSLSIKESLQKAPAYTAKAVTYSIAIITAAFNSSREEWPTLDFGAKTAFRLNQTHVWRLFILFCINLAILNLLPLPSLNGGQILLTMIHMVRGRPVSERAQNVFQAIFAITLLVMMLMVSFRNDRRRLANTPHGFGSVFSTRVSGSASYLRATERNPTWSF
jgi:regulator of sigma E protease